MRVRIGQLEVIVDTMEELDHLVKRYAGGNPLPPAEKEAYHQSLGIAPLKRLEEVVPDPTTKARSDPAVATGISCVGWIIKRDGQRIRRGVEVDEMGVNRAIYTATSYCVRAEAVGDVVERKFLTDPEGKECGDWAYDLGAVNNFRREQDHPPSMTPLADVKVKFSGPAEEA